MSRDGAMAHICALNLSLHIILTPLSRCWVVDGHRGKCFLLAQAPTSQTAVRASLLGYSVGASIKLENDTETSFVLAINSKVKFLS